MRKRQKLKRVQKSCIGRGIITITLHAQSSPYLFHSVPLCIQADTHTYIPCLWIQPGKLHCCSTCWRNTCSDEKIYVALFFFKIRRGGGGRERNSPIMICTILITIFPPPSPPHWHIPPCYSVGDYWIPLRSPWKQCDAQKFLTLPSPFIKWSLAKIDILHPLIASNVLVISTLRKRDQIFFFFFAWMFCLPSYYSHWYNDHKRQSAHLKPQFALLGKLRS